MKALRLVLHQNRAHYRKENTFTSRMTYPLPPLSTIIGTIHSICNWKEYIPMDVSIQGKFEALDKEIHNLQSFTNSCMDDRYTLVKLCNPDVYYNKYIPVSKSLVKQGAIHSQEHLTKVFNKELLEEYKQLRINKEVFTIEKKELTLLLKDIKNKKKSIKDKTSQEFIEVLEQEEEVSTKLKTIKNKIEKNNKDYSLFKTVTTSPTIFEVLYNVDLIIYLKFDDVNRLEEIKENLFKLGSLGRTEDSVSIIDCSIVELEKPKKETSSYKDYISYVNIDDINDDSIFEKETKGDSLGTNYYLNKNYEIIDNKRIFQKKIVRLMSCYKTDELANNVYVDEYNNESVIVSFN